MTRLLRVAAATSLIGAVAFGPATLAAPASSAKKCSTKNLRYERMQGSVTESVAVRRLRARSATCAKARSIAAVVAKDLLNGREVPNRVKGFAIDVEGPCDSCAPITEVKATRGSKRVTFKVAGGA